MKGRYQMRLITQIPKHITIHTIKNELIFQITNSTVTHDLLVPGNFTHQLIPHVSFWLVYKNVIVAFIEATVPHNLEGRFGEIFN